MIKLTHKGFTLMIIPNNFGESIKTIENYLWLFLFMDMKELQMFLNILTFILWHAIILTTNLKKDSDCNV